MRESNVQRLVKKFIGKLREDGLRNACKQTYRYMKGADPVHKRRLALSQSLNLLFHSTVAYGPFKGLKLQENAWWGSKDRGCMLLGIYEQEILASLSNLPATHKTFIDLGAADGYYGIGMLASGLANHSYCFETSSTGRDVIRMNAIKNGVTHKVNIQGTANKNFYNDLPADQLAKSILFVDIEGGEFDLFDKQLFSIFRGAIIFIELHDWFFENGDQKLQQLLNDASEYFHVTELTTTYRDMSIFPELSTYSDDDRWILCSEGRRQLMKWLRLDPKGLV